MNDGSTAWSAHKQACCAFLSKGVRSLGGAMYKLVQLLICVAINATVLHGQQISFFNEVYPVLKKAGCRACHNPEGVASPTRLHFPEQGVSSTRIEAFGKSLVELVDQNDIETSLGNTPRLIWMEMCSPRPDRTSRSVGTK